MTVEEPNVCWQCGFNLRTEIERQRKECLQCFALKDGPYEPEPDEGDDE